MQSFLIDLDGVLYVGKNPVQGARECLNRMEGLGYDYRFVSNSTRRCRTSVSRRLQSLGYDIDERKIFTPPLAAIDRMKKAAKERCFLLTAGDVHRDFEDADIIVADRDVDFVVVGDAGDRFTFKSLNRAMRLILDGADILALEKDRYGWNPRDGSFPQVLSWQRWSMPQERELSLWESLPGIFSV
jgi:ribonucleotide monophosphatase NagD (HAD superfamily)